MPTLLAPDVSNIPIGKGEVKFRKHGITPWTHMGNCPEFEFTPAIEQLDHYSAMAGVRAKDITRVIEKGGQLRILGEEWTVQNMSIAMLGSIDMLHIDGPRIEIMSENAFVCEVLFEATNEVGPRWNFHFYNVSFIPSSAINPISDEWGSFEVNGEVLIAPAGHAEAGRFGHMWITNLPDEGS